MLRLIQFALIFAVALAGCDKTKSAGPTEAERAQIYLAAKAELDEIRKAEEEMESLIDRVRETGDGSVPKDVMEDYLSTMTLYKQRREAAEKTMAANSPSSL